MKVFDQNVVLFKSAEDEEGLEVGCTITNDGGMVLLQESCGPFTEWSFDEPVHRIEVAVGPREVCALMAYFHIDRANQLPLVLRMDYTGYDCCQQIRLLIRHLGLPYEVIEDQVAR